ncbi:universal stress protein [Halegenticoccus tardaugens]|uniref:universal stress protein n=1 Tax=Halegenticoccus tardaugens TaxID=2071624 RepID=UPI00100BD7E7|nr:universal stress protein [Halegenticoccus tardaugens]
MLIVAAVDRTGPREMILDEASALADAFGDDLHVVHAMSQSTFRDLEMKSVEKTGQTIDIDDVRALAREIAEEAVDEAGVESTAVGVVGDPADAVLKYATNRSTRYIAVGGKRRTPVGKALFGSVTQAVLLNSDLPVVTVTTDDQ